MQVPFISNLHRVPSRIDGVAPVAHRSEADFARRRSGKQSTWPRDELIRNHRLAWKEYVRGHIVSVNALNMIRNWLSAICMYSSKGDDVNDEGRTMTTTRHDSSPDQTVSHVNA